MHSFVNFFLVGARPLDTHRRRGPPVMYEAAGLMARRSSTTSCKLVALFYQDGRYRATGHIRSSIATRNPQTGSLYGSQSTLLRARPEVQYRGKVQTGTIEQNTVLDHLAHKRLRQEYHEHTCKCKQRRLVAPIKRQEQKGGLAYRHRHQRGTASAVAASAGPRCIRHLEC
jgi:hypothetical protein